MAESGGFSVSMGDMENFKVDRSVKRDVNQIQS